MGGKFSVRNKGGKGKSTTEDVGPSLRNEPEPKRIIPTYAIRSEDGTGEVEFRWQQRDVMDEEWRHVGAASQLIKRRCHRLYAESGRPFDLVLFTLNGSFTAMSTWCSHMGGPLHEGDIEDYKGKKCVQCPWHGYMFDVETGVNPDIGLRQEVFETRVVDNKVYVHYPRCKLSMEPFNS